MHLVHCVFVGHGYQNEQPEDLGGLPKVRYLHSQKPPLAVVYAGHLGPTASGAEVPMQRHLVTYAGVEGGEPLKAWARGS